MVKEIGFPSRRYSAIAHRFLPVAAPVGEDVLAGLLDVLPLESGARVLDAGCGRGELPLRLAQRFGARVLGVDTDERALADARAAARQRQLSDLAEFRCMPALDLPAGGKFDFAICVGSSHACGGYGAALEFLAERVRPGGTLLMGEGYWKRPPTAEYLKFLGAEESDLGSHYGNTRRAAALGLETVWSFASRAEDWDRYEGLYRLAMHRWLGANPDDPHRDEFAQRSARWYDGYLRWGRDVMGFGLYLFARR
ncbi:MAG: SAM-dependent methyltransferase [Alphaproteobacteria bacterium]